MHNAHAQSSVNAKQTNAELKAQQTFETMKPNATSIYVRSEFKIYKTFEIRVLANYMGKRNEKGCACTGYTVVYT